MSNHAHTSSKLDEFPNKKTNKPEDFLHKIVGKSGQLKTDLEGYSEVTVQYIRRHPVRSTLIAGLAGIVLGKLLSK